MLKGWPSSYTARKLRQIPLRDSHFHCERKEGTDAY